jgi:hypothetical protein
VKARSLALVASLLLARGATAGMLNDPPPVFDGGTPGRVVYRMGPIYFEAGRADTVILCTNVCSWPLIVGIEIFDASDQVVASGDRSGVAPGAQVVFDTSADPTRSGEVVVSPRASVAHGKARVSATATTLSCVGHQVMLQDDGTPREIQLELVKKVAF